MNERIYNLSRQAEQQAREHVRECEYYGYTMIEGTAEDEFHAEFRDRFAELIVRECADIASDVGTDTVPTDFALDKCYEIESKIKERFGVK